MAYTNKYRLTEERFGERMSTLLPRLLNQHSAREVAAMFGVNRKTIYEWAEIAGLKRCYVPADECPVVTEPERIA